MQNLEQNTQILTVEELKLPAPVSKRSRFGICDGFRYGIPAETTRLG